MPIDGDINPEWTRNFITGMQRNAKDRASLVVKALGTAGVHRVLDLGGGSGAYSIAFAKASPDVKCEILDLPEVVPLTAKFVRDAGVSTQVSRHADLWVGLRLVFDKLGDDHGRSEERRVGKEC